MNCFLIDFENVRSSGLSGIEHLTNVDDVCIFYSDYANSITFDIHHNMNKSSANITFFRSTKTGKNALDFQLISYLGYLIAQKKYKNYYIVTGDRGFEAAISFWKDFFKDNRINYLNIGRFYTIKDALERKNIPNKNVKDTLPTIPTVESELELRQLKAEKVLVDISSNRIEKVKESSLNHNDKKMSDLKKDGMTENRPKPNTNTNNKSCRIETIQKSVEIPSIDDVPKKDVDNGDTTLNLNGSKISPQVKDTKKVQSQNGSNNSNNNKQLRPKDENKVKNKNRSQKPTQSVTNKNRLNSVSQPINGNVNKQVTNSPNGNGKVQNKVNSKLKDSNLLKLNYVEPTKLPLQATKPAKSGPSSDEKIVSHSDLLTVTEKVEKQEVYKKTFPQPPKVDLVDNTPQKEVADEVGSKDQHALEPNITPIEGKSERLKDDTKVESQKVETLSIKKPKRGRPRTKPIEETLKTESKKPKNNKKFQEDISQDKLSKMVEQLSKLPTVSEYSQEDLTTICKVVAFGNRNECYRAFMSLLGKQKALECYPIVKQQFDTLKKLFES